MKVLVDANVLISALIAPQSVPGLIVEQAFSGAFAIVVSEWTISEVQSSCRRKPYLIERIPQERITGFVAALQSGGFTLPHLATPSERFTRDPKDDYLIAHALAEQVDVLVSGDRDLLVLDGTFPFRILTPAEFVEFLSEERGSE